MNESEVLEMIEKTIGLLLLKKNKPIRVAINGIEGTGKTVFANKLNHYLINRGIKSIQVSIDGFHFNKEVRYRKGRDSALGYYEDSYDELAFVNKVLISSQAEYPNVTLATHDLESDKYLTLQPIEIPNDSVIITDGAYLFKPNYLEHWDLKIYLKTSFDIAMQRGAERDKDLLGGFDYAIEKFKKRYHEASKIYLAENSPETKADIIIDISDFNFLRILKK